MKLIMIVLALICNSIAVANPSTNIQSIYHLYEEIKIPLSKGTFIMLLWKGGDPIWFDTQTEWFQPTPIRNYTTQFHLYLPANTPIGSYDLLEIGANGNDPTNYKTWNFVNSYPIRVCDSFSPPAPECYKIKQ